MTIQQIYILIAVCVLAIIIGLKFILLKKKQIKSNISLFTGLALIFLVASIAFGQDRMISYVLVSIGLIFALIDLVKKLKKQK